MVARVARKPDTVTDLLRRIAVLEQRQLAPSDTFLALGDLAKRYKKCALTLNRWRRDPRFNFPAPDFVLADRSYWRTQTLEAWERAQAGRSAA